MSKNKKIIHDCIFNFSFKNINHACIFISSQLHLFPPFLILTKRRSIFSRGVYFLYNSGGVLSLQNIYCVISFNTSSERCVVIIKKGETVEPHFTVNISLTKTSFLNDDNYGDNYGNNYGDNYDYNCKDNYKRHL